MDLPGPPGLVGGLLLGDFLKYFRDYSKDIWDYHGPSQFGDLLSGEGLEELCPMNFPLLHPSPPDPERMSLVQIFGRGFVEVHLEFSRLVWDTLLYSWE